jgi:hypothetical protein
MQKNVSIKTRLADYEKHIIEKTKSTITIEDQLNGKLIQRLPQDSDFINTISAQFFETVNYVCRQADLATMANVITAVALKKKRKAIIEGKIIPGIASMPLTKKVDDVLKRSKAIYQRIRITLRTTTKVQIASTSQGRLHTLEKYLHDTIRRLGNQLSQYITSIKQLSTVCAESNDDRLNHIQALEAARNKKTYDCEMQ